MGSIVTIGAGDVLHPNPVIETSDKAVADLQASAGADAECEHAAVLARLGLIGVPISHVHEDIRTQRPQIGIISPTIGFGAKFQVANPTVVGIVRALVGAANRIETAQTKCFAEQQTLGRYLARETTGQKPTRTNGIAAFVKKPRVNVIG